MSTYQLRKIGQALKAGDARIEARVSIGDGTDLLAWAVTMYQEWRTVHVPIYRRPTWLLYWHRDHTAGDVCTLCDGEGR